MHQRKMHLDACQSHLDQRVQRNIGIMPKELTVQTATIMDLRVPFKENWFYLVYFSVTLSGTIQFPLSRLKGTWTVVS